MKKKIIFLAFLLALLFCGCLALPASAETNSKAEESPYYIYVGNRAVTPENASDILGDGTASYDVEKDILTLRNYTTELCTQYTYEQSTFYFSVYCDVKTSIVIEGNCTLRNAIYTADGNVSIKNANVTFTGSGFAMLLSDGGSIVAENSTIQVSNLAQVAEYGFAADYIQLKNTTFTMDTGLSSRYPVGLFHAEKTVSTENTTMSIIMAYPLVQNVFSGGELMFANSHIDISGANYAFYSKDNAMYIYDSTINVDKSRLFCDVQGLGCSGSTVVSKTYQQGIQTVSPENASALIITDSDLTLSMLSFDVMEEYLLRSSWVNMSAFDKGTYQQSYEVFKQVQENAYKDKAEASVGIVVSKGAAQIIKTNIKTEGFACGLMGLFGSSLALGKDLDLQLSAQKVGFIWLCDGASDIHLPSRHKTEGGDFTYNAAPESMASIGKEVFTISHSPLTYLEGVEPDNLAKLIASCSPLEPTVRIKTPPYLPPYAIAIFVAMPVLLVIGVGAYFIFNPTSPSKKHKKSKPQVR